MTTITPKEVTLHGLETEWGNWSDDGQLGRVPAAPEPDGEAAVPARLRSELCI
jgi:hypothetical protein